MKNRKLLSVSAIALVLLLCLSTAAYALPAPTTMQPKVMSSCVARLTVTSNGLQEYARILYNTSQETLYSVKLERIVNGAWQTYSSTGLILTTDNPVIHDVLSSPQKGYTYRLYVEASANMGNFSFYSSSVYY